MTKVVLRPTLLGVPLATVLFAILFTYLGHLWLEGWDRLDYFEKFNLGLAPAAILAYLYAVCGMLYSRYIRHDKVTFDEDGLDDCLSKDSLGRIHWSGVIDLTIKRLPFGNAAIWVTYKSKSDIHPKMVQLPGLKMSKLEMRIIKSLSRGD